jgi:hypothetical protein
MENLQKIRLETSITRSVTWHIRLQLGQNLVQTSEQMEVMESRVCLEDKDDQFR